MSKAVIVESEILTPFGLGLEKCWTNLCEGHSAVKPVERFDVSGFGCSVAAIIDGLQYHNGPSLVWQMLTQLSPETIPNDSALMLATTTGEVDILEQAVLENNRQCSGSHLNELLKKVQNLYGLQCKASIVSSACTSSSTAIGLAAASIESGNDDSVLVVTCDAVTEFVFTGFSSLMALDPGGAKPFDEERQGLSLGEAAGYILLMSEDRAKRENRSISGYVLGWGLSNDANHMTGPSRDGGGLVRAINLALKTADIDSESIGFICAHGTGTRYNDAMEMEAFKKVFSKPKDTFSVKGALGHTLGAAGLLETALTLHSLKMKTIPASSMINKVDEDAKDWIVTNKKIIDCKVALTTNSGFGGVNAALVIGR